jgi:uncharacterized membrane protein YbhN (UPF0104 family)
VAISSVTLWLALRNVDLSEVGAAIGGADPLQLGVGTIAVLVTFPLLGLRWHAVAGRRAGRRTSMVDLTLIGAAVNNVLPGRLGEVARAAGLARDTRRSAFAAFGTVVIDRLSDLTLLALCLCATVLASPAPYWAQWIVVLGSAAALAGVGIAAGIVWAVRRRGVPVHGRWRVRVGAFAQGLDCIESWPAALRVSLWTVAVWTAWMSGAWLVAQAVGVALSPLEVVFMTGVVGIGSAIPSAPGFIGTYHWLASSTLILYGVSRPDAVAFAVLIHASWFLPTTLIGCALMVRRGITWNSLRSVSVSPPAEPQSSPT